jgi:hypothetical protein
VYTNICKSLVSLAKLVLSSGDVSTNIYKRSGSLSKLVLSCGDWCLQWIGVYEYMKDIGVS